MKFTKRVAAPLAALFAATTGITEAQAAGLYVSDRGVRPMGRGGAFVAGADDLGAIWYNPAGIAEASSSFLLDGSWVNYSDTYTRHSQSVSAAGATYDNGYPTVKGSTPFLPIPTIAGSLRFGPEKRMAAAIGVFTPDFAVLSYPLTIDGGQPAPQRYSLVSLNGSILAVLGGYFAYRPVDMIEFGAGVQMLTGFFKTTIDFSACPPNNLVCAQQDPSYDANSAVNAGPIFAPSANAGATFIPSHRVRIGVSGQLPYVIDASTTVKVRLPDAPEFDNAYQQGTKAHLHLELPPVLRAGIEFRPLSDDRLRIELAYVREFWSVEKSLDITPNGIQLYQITGFPSPFGVNKISVPRGMQDSNSFRLGGEFRLDVGHVGLIGRAGVSYETSSLPAAYETPLTVDANKVVASLGGGLAIGRLRIDVMVSHPFQSDANVPSSQAAVPLINPVQGNPTMSDTVNGGIYHVNLWVWGAGLEYRL